MISASKITALLGRAPTPAEIDAIHRLQGINEIKDTDPLLGIYVHHVGHDSMLSGAPQKIAAAVAEAADQATALVTAETKKQVSVTIQEAGDAIAQTALQVAPAMATNSLVKWLSVCIAVLAIAIVASNYFAFKKGEESGMTQGYAKAFDEKAAFAWSNTETAKLARKMNQYTLSTLLHCTHASWKAEKGRCVPYANLDQTLSAWPLP